MNEASTTPQANSPKNWSRILIIVGSLATVLGAADPLEGSLLILPGSGLVALGTFLAQNERQWFAYRLRAFVLIAIGVGALWGLSAIGGIGGKGGLSMWWGLLILPYLIGWCMSILGPGTPRWTLILAIVVGLWYLAIFSMLMKNGGKHGGDVSGTTSLVVGTLGVVTICGSIVRLIRRTPERQ